MVIYMVTKLENTNVAKKIPVLKTLHENDQ